MTGKNALCEYNCYSGTGPPQSIRYGAEHTFRNRSSQGSRTEIDKYYSGKGSACRSKQFSLSSHTTSAVRSTRETLPSANPNLQRTNPLVWLLVAQRLGLVDNHHRPCQRAGRAYWLSKWSWRMMLRLQMSRCN